MKRSEIATLVLSAGFLICDRTAFANLTDGSAPPEAATYRNDSRVQIEQSLQNIAADHTSTVGTSDQNNNDSAVAAAFSIDGTAADFLQASGILHTLTDGSVPNWIMGPAINRRSQIDGSFDDATGQHDLLDSGGIVVTLRDPHRGGGAVTVGINSNGQIVGNVYSLIGDRSLSERPRIAEAREPSAFPFLAGCVPVVALVLLRRRKRGRNR
jgi:hypothetical protein